MGKCGPRMGRIFHISQSIWMVYWYNRAYHSSVFFPNWNYFSKRILSNMWGKYGPGCRWKGHNPYLLNRSTTNHQCNHDIGEQGPWIVFMNYLSGRSSAARRLCVFLPCFGCRHTLIWSFFCEWKQCLGELEILNVTCRRHWARHCLNPSKAVQRQFVRWFSPSYF